MNEEQQRLIERLKRGGLGIVEKLEIVDQLAGLGPSMVVLDKSSMTPDQIRSAAQHVALGAAAAEADAVSEAFVRTGVFNLKFKNSWWRRAIRAVARWETRSSYRKPDSVSGYADGGKVGA